MKFDLIPSALKLAANDALTPGSIVMQAHPGHPGKLFLVTRLNSGNQGHVFFALDGNLPFVGYPNILSWGGFINLAQPDEYRIRLDSEVRAEQDESFKRGRLILSDTGAFVAAEWQTHVGMQYGYINLGSGLVDSYTGQTTRHLDSWELVIRDGVMPPLIIAVTAADGE